MGETYRIEFRMKAACDRVTGFRFDKPAGYEFKAGQYFRLTLQTPAGERTESFSHASAPGDPFIEMATRMTGSPFKETLGNLVRGDEVSIEGPFGSLMLPPDAHRACFLAGGVGITPARSIIRDAEQRRTGLRMRLFYGNHDQACIPYSGEFAEYSRKDRRFEVVHVLQEPLPGWTGEVGFITADVVRRNLGSAEGWHFFVGGPPDMVSAMQGVLAEVGVAEEHTSIEHFTGY